MFPKRKGKQDQDRTAFLKGYAEGYADGRGTPTRDDDERLSDRQERDRRAERLYIENAHLAGKVARLESQLRSATASQLLRDGFYTIRCRCGATMTANDMGSLIIAAMQHQRETHS